MKFIPTILTLLLAAPSAAADLPPVRDTRRRRDRKLGGVGGKSSTRTRMAEEVEVDVADNNKPKPSCASTSPVVAVEQVVLAFQLTALFYDGPFDFLGLPSMQALFGDTTGISGPEDLIYGINSILAEMPCGDYEKQEEYSLVLIDLLIEYGYFGGGGLSGGSKGFFNSTFTPEPDDSSNSTPTPEPEDSSNSTLTPEDSSP
jgi:hypothetical protein